ncbi:hypothetical protein F2Q68_00046068, partial [Brassica cretica]
RRSASLLKETIDKLITEKLDAKNLICDSNTFCIADLGCATGPNTFFLVQDIIKSVETTLDSNSTKAEFLVFFNDLTNNDFNTLFTSLPQDRSYFAVGVPGSFYGRVLPQSSVHIVVTLAATHWLSSVPKELFDKSSKAWNKGKVHYSNAAEEVVKAYEDQFGRDMEKFLEARAQEIVSGGLLVVGMCGIPQGMPFSNLADSIMYTSMADVLIQMQSQRRSASLLRETIDKLIMEKIDAKTLISCTNTFHIADLGCATGPNTFSLVEDIIKSIDTSLQSNSTKPEFLVFFNDLPSNDFNTLFTSLPPDRSYFAVGVPGSFYSRILPQSSVHIVLTVGATHWLSSVPKEVLDKSSKAWNKGKVHYSNASEEVVKAYEEQFGRDMERFLEARAKEIVSGGLLVVGMCGIPLGMPFSNLADSIMYNSMADVLIQMQSQGLISEEQVDTFNVPIYSASPEEVTVLVEKNGCFTIEFMELMDPTAWLKRPMDVEDVRQWIVCIKATMGSLFINHFGDHLLDDIFDRLTTKLVGLTEKVESSYREKVMLFFALKRK